VEEWFMPLWLPFRQLLTDSGPIGPGPACIVCTNMDAQSPAAIATALKQQITGDRAPGSSRSLPSAEICRRAFVLLLALLLGLGAQDQLENAASARGPASAGRHAV